MNHRYPEMIDVAEVARVLRVNSKTVRRWLAEQSTPLRGVLVGHQWRIFKLSLDEMLNQEDHNAEKEPLTPADHGDGR